MEFLLVVDPHARIAQYLEYDCSSKSESGGSAMHLDIASYKFDSSYVFILYDKMDCFKEQASYICNWVEECLRKDENILQCLK